jgi:hypothetical protein
VERVWAVSVTKRRNNIGICPRIKSLSLVAGASFSLERPSETECLVCTEGREMYNSTFSGLSDATPLLNNQSFHSWEARRCPAGNDRHAGTLSKVNLTLLNDPLYVSAQTTALKS